MPKELKETMDKQPKEVRTWYMNKMRLSVKGIKKNVKRNQIEILEMNNTISEMENSLEEFDNRFEQAK